MGINRNKEHLVVYLEDRPYREIMNGVKRLPYVNSTVLDVKPPVGGWGKVFATLEENFKLLEKYRHMHVLLLMDFDNAYQKRIQQLSNCITNRLLQNRIFILGIEHKESEDLKRTLKQSNYEQIAAILLKDCRENNNEQWKNQHLICNLSELARMRNCGLFDWLFQW